MLILHPGCVPLPLNLVPTRCLTQALDLALYLSLLHLWLWLWLYPHLWLHLNLCMHLHLWLYLRLWLWLGVSWQRHCGLHDVNQRGLHQI